MIGNALTNGAFLQMYFRENSNTIYNVSEDIKRISERIKEEINNHNHFLHTLQQNMMAHPHAPTFDLHVSTNVAHPPGAHEGQYNLPTSNGTVACIIIGDQQLGTSKNKIAVTAVNGETKYLNVGAPQSDPLSYTFFFPYATSGYFFDINNKKKTPQRWYRYYLMMCDTTKTKNAAVDMWNDAMKQ